MSAAAERRRARTAWLFLAPMLLALALVAAWPLARTTWLGFTDATLFAPGAQRFVGLANYRLLFADPDWWRAVANTLVFATVSVALETVLGLLVALLLDAKLRGRGVLRAAMLVPWAIPTVVSAQLWAWMLHDQHGVVNAMLVALGVIAEPRAWLAEPWAAMAWIVAVDVWKSTPFMALLSLAALQLVPRAVMEAARIDGLGPVGIFFRITLPLIRPALLVAILFRLLDALRVFDLMYVLAGSGPATASMSVHARQLLVDFGEVGEGSAAATALVLVVVACATLVAWLGRLRLGGAGR